MEGIDKKLLTDIYYLDLMSMFLRESYGITDRIKALTNLLKAIDNVYNKIIGQLDIFNKDYSINYIDNSVTKKNVYLDTVGNIFGIKRSFTINYGTNVKPVNETNLIAGNKRYITLSDREFLIYLKLQIIKQSFLGTREELAILYGGESISDTLTGLKLIYIPRSTESLNVDIYWQDCNNNYSTDFRYLFLNGYLTIESLGIKYNHNIANITNIMSFRESRPKDHATTNDFDIADYGQATEEPWRIFG